MKVTTVGIDLAKNVFRVHGCDARGRTVFSKQLTRRQLPGFLANLPRCLVGMEACSSAHYWAREIQKLGHEVRLMTPRFVRPYVKANKNDASDAEAICEAMRRPADDALRCGQEPGSAGRASGAPRASSTGQGAHRRGPGQQVTPHLKRPNI